MKHLKSWEQLNELHSDTYYSAANKWKERNPNAKGIIGKFRKAGKDARDRERNERVKALWETYPDTEYEKDFKKFQNEFNYIFEHEPGYIEGKIDYKNKVEKNPKEDTYLLLEFNEDGYMQIMLMVTWDEDNPDDEQLSRIDDKYWEEEGSFMGSWNSVDKLSDKRTAKRLYRFIQKYKDKINIDFFHRKDGADVKLEDLKWWDLWNGSEPSEDTE